VTPSVVVAQLAHRSTRSFLVSFYKAALQL